MIYHITHQDAWAHAQKRNVYQPVGFSEDGFIHCSDLHQVAKVANSFYKGIDGLIVLAIDPELTGAKLVYENTDGGTELFPHLYGLLPTDAVLSTFALEVDGSGQFCLPMRFREV